MQNFHKRFKRTGGLGRDRTPDRPVMSRMLYQLSYEPTHVEATEGFEPSNRDFADLRLRPLGYVAPSRDRFYHRVFNMSTG